MSPDQRSLHSARSGSVEVDGGSSGVARFEPAGILPSGPGAGWTLSCARNVRQWRYTLGAPAPPPALGRPRREVATLLASVGADEPKERSR